MNDPTRALIEEYLVEAYKSVAPAVEADRLAAEKAFKFELTNGPEKMVYYAGKGSFPKKIGTFDLDNFHKAYDQWFEENGLLDMFREDGKLFNKGTYADFKDLDRTIPAVKAVGQLWGVQFKGDMEFTKDAAAKAEAKKKEEEALSTLTAECDKYVKQIKDEIESSAEFKTLVEKYPAELRDQVKVEVKDEIDCDGTPYYYNLELRLLGIITAPTAAADYEKDDYIISRSSTSYKSIADLKPVATLADDIKKEAYEKIAAYTKSISVALYLTKNHSELATRPEAALQKEKGFNYLGYYNLKDKKCYITHSLEFPVSGAPDKFSLKGTVLVNIENKKETAMLTKDFVLVCARFNASSYSHGAYMHYEKSSNDDYYDSSVNKATLKRFNIDTKERRDGVGTPCYEIVKISAAEEPFNTFFDTRSHYEYFCDSSD